MNENLSLLLSKKLFSFSFLFLLAHSSTERTPRSPRRSRSSASSTGAATAFCDIASATVKTEGGTHSAPGSCAASAAATSSSGTRRAAKRGRARTSRSTRSAWTAPRCDSRSERHERAHHRRVAGLDVPVASSRDLAPGRPSAATSPRLAEETDHALLSAAADYLEQGLEDDGLAAEEQPILSTLLSVEEVSRRPPPRPDAEEGAPRAGQMAATESRGARKRPSSRRSARADALQGQGRETRARDGRPPRTAPGRTRPHEKSSDPCRCGRCGSTSRGGRTAPGPRGTVDGERVRGRVVEREPGRPLEVRAVVRDDGVREASRAPHDRRRPVGERVHLAEAARLEARRHDERVRARLDPVRERLVVPDERLEAARDGAPRGAASRPPQAGSPDPSITILTPRRTSSGADSRRRSNPFWSVSRPIAPTTNPRVRRRRSPRAGRGPRGRRPCPDRSDAE